MTELQQDLALRLLKGDRYLLPKPNFKGQHGFMLYVGNANPEKWFPYKAFKGVKELLKKDKKGKLTLNLNLVRQIHGNTLINKQYKKSKNGTRSNKPQTTIQN